MAINIGKMTTDISAEPEQQVVKVGSDTKSDPMQEQTKLRIALAEAVRLEQRTRAEAYDD